MKKRKIPLYNGTLKNLENRLRAFQGHTPEMLKEIILKHKDTIVELVTQRQLYEQGIEGFGKKIMDYKPYALSTIKAKRRKNQPYSRVTLKNKGNFYRQTYIVFNSDGFYITSRSKVTPILVKKYGRSIFRLTDQNLTYVIKEIVRKELVTRLKATLHEGSKR